MIHFVHLSCLLKFCKYQKFLSLIRVSSAKKKITSAGSYDFIFDVSGPGITIKDRQNDMYSCHGLAESVFV